MVYFFESAPEITPEMEATIQAAARIAVTDKSRWTPSARMKAFEDMKGDLLAKGMDQIAAECWANDTISRINECVEALRASGASQSGRA